MSNENDYNSSSSVISDDDDREGVTSSENEDDAGITLTADSNGTTTSLNENRPTDYKILTESEIFDEMERIANDTSAVFGYSPSICRTILSNFKWSKETLLERFYEAKDPDTFFRNAHLLNPSQGMLCTATQKQCKICYDTKMLTGLQCGHLFCYDCWTGYLSGKIVADGCPHIPCPEHKCDYILDDDSILKFIHDSKVKHSYKQLVLNSFVDSNPQLKWCPGTGCGRVVKVPHSESRPVTCQCGFVFCFLCSEQWHEPVTCALLKKWLKKCNDDSETSNWLNANTKDCPKCHVTIEKDGGCNHMTCKNVSCRFEFCWTCLGPWAPHGSGWYSCNRFNDETAKKARDEQERSRAALQRYLHYYNRYTNHHNSLKLENKLYAQVDRKMNQMQAQNFSWIETQFLKKAIDVLGECRRALMYTYAFAFYLQQNNITKIFEDNQKDLELATEQLSEFLERDLVEENLVTLKQKVQDKFRYVEHRRTLLLKHCAEGYENNQWVFCKESQSSTQLIMNNNNNCDEKK